MLLAHREIDSNGNILEQNLTTHLFRTGDRAGDIGRTIGLEEFMRLAGYLHDCGKADRFFQDLIRGRTKRKVNHSSAGGKILDDYIRMDEELTALKNSKLKFQYFQECLTYILFSHHGLYDLIVYGTSEYTTYQRLRYDESEEYHYHEDVVPFVQIMDQEMVDRGKKSITDLIKNAYLEFEMIYLKLKKLVQKNSKSDKRKEEKAYYISCLTRLCLSILKEADIYDSANAFLKSKQRIWKEEEQLLVWKHAYKHVEDMYHKYESNPNPSRLNQYRNEIAVEVKRAAFERKDGIFKLELPTGAGKTKAGMRYALVNANQYKKSRVVYVTAYLSVLEQNAGEIKNILKMEEAVLEHHSNMIEEKKTSDNEGDEEEYSLSAYLKDSWEQPVILTTMVQFLNTLYKDKASNIRRFCKLINSVIIMDEVQSLPMKVVSNLNLMMNFMKEIMKCNIVHCTATQPAFDSEILNYPVYYGDKEDKHVQITEQDWRRKDCFERVDFYNLTGVQAQEVLSTEELSELITEQLQVYDSCLVILNTKKAVLKLYDFLEKTQEAEIIYLTTNLCAAHRLDIISELKKKLLHNRKNKDKECHKLICISTQLVEAGVDLDFDIVYRSLAGIDSLIQCAGRCNREGKLEREGNSIRGKLFIMKYREENLSKLQDIKEAANASEYAIRTYYEKSEDTDSLLRMETLQKPYFEKYYASNLGKLDYNDAKRGSNMVEELGMNLKGRAEYFTREHSEKRPVMFQAFRTAAENFQLIEEGTTGIIVSYHNQELLDRLEEAVNEKSYGEIKVLLQQLQRYTINVYLSEEMMPFLVEYKEYNVYFLLKQYYNENKGILITELADLII